MENGTRKIKIKIKNENMKDFTGRKSELFDLALFIKYVGMPLVSVSFRKIVGVFILESEETESVLSSFIYEEGGLNKEEAFISLLLLFSELILL